MSASANNPWRGRQQPRIVSSVQEACTMFRQNRIECLPSSAVVATSKFNLLTGHLRHHDGCASFLAPLRSKSDSFCIFSSTRSNPHALVVVGTKSWSCASMVFAFIKRVLAEMTRDPADIGYWQLRSLAWRAEEVAVGDVSKSRALLPRLLEGYDWNDEESECWEDDDMWADLANDLQTGQGTEAASAVIAPIASRSIDETGNSGTSIPLSTHAQARAGDGASDAKGASMSKDSGYQGVSAAKSQDWKAPSFEANFDDQPNEQSVIFLPLKQAPVSRGAPSASLTVIDHGKPPVVALAGGKLPLAPAQAPADGPPSVDTDTLHGHTMATGAVPLAAGAVASHVLGGPSAAETPPQKERFFAGDGSPDKGAPSPGDSSPAGLAEGRPGASATRNVAPPSDSVVAPAAVSVAVSEDLAYVHRGSILQSYAVTGSVLVAASPGTRARIRVTDTQGHIATATGNAAVVEETATTAPTREYLCKPRAAQAPGVTGPSFLPTVMYRCSPAVKQLPVRATCRLRLAGSAVFVWVQVIANPQVPQSLSGVSVLVHMPFVPRQEEGVVKSEPPATWKAESRMLEWVLPAPIKRGGKQVVQARLSLEEGGVRVASVPSSAPVMVKCHLLDSMFSSVELQASGVAREGDVEVSGRVMKRCRVQCRQQP